MRRVAGARSNKAPMSSKRQICLRSGKAFEEQFPGKQYRRLAARFSRADVRSRSLETILRNPRPKYRTKVAHQMLRNWEALVERSVPKHGIDTADIECRRVKRLNQGKPVIHLVGAASSDGSVSIQTGFEAKAVVAQISMINGALTRTAPQLPTSSITAIAPLFCPDQRPPEAEQRRSTCA